MRTNRIPTIGLLLALSQAARTYDSAHAAAIKRCEAIDPAKYQTGLLFNPDGYRSYYEQSACFQKAAVEFRDEQLCGRVRRRLALFSSSWGYSAGNCRTLVAQATEADRKELDDIRRQYLVGHMELRDFQIERNGNGRDYDFIPSFTGTSGHGYTITIEILPAVGSAVSIHSNGYFVDARGAMRLYLPQRDISASFPAFVPGTSYRVRATMTFSLPAGGGSRWLSDAVLERTFPLRERMQSIVHDARF